MKKLLIYGLLAFSCLAGAQEKKEPKKDKDLPKGNREYAEKKYAEAEADYRVSSSKNPEKAASLFNLGNAIYRQKQSEEAKTQYKKTIATAKSYFEKHRAYHNLGNIYMAEKKYQEAVEAYKNALRNNPDDEETRYNYALAKKFLKDNPPPKDKNDKDKKKQQQQQKQQQQNKQDQNKDQDKNQGQNQPQPKGGQDKNQQPPKPAPGGIPKQRLESLLKAVDNEEKKVQDRVNAKREQAPPVQTDKDW